MDVDMVVYVIGIRQDWHFIMQVCQDLFLLFFLFSKSCHGVHHWTVCCIYSYQIYQNWSGKEFGSLSSWIGSTWLVGYWLNIFIKMILYFYCVDLNEFKLYFVKLIMFDRVNILFNSIRNSIHAKFWILSFLHQSYFFFENLQKNNQVIQYYFLLFSWCSNSKLSFLAFNALLSDFFAYHPSFKLLTQICLKIVSHAIQPFSVRTPIKILNWILHSFRCNSTLFSRIA